MSDLPSTAQTYQRLTGVDPFTRKKIGNEYAVPCINASAHNRGDQNPSLHIHADGKGWICRVCGQGGGALAMVKFAGHAKTDAEALAWLGVDRDVQPARVEQRAASKLIARYPYRNLDGTVLYEVLRYEPKDFRQRRIDAQGREVWKLDGVERVLYRLPEIAKAVSENRSVIVAEGEKDCDNLAKLGFVATTNAGGAGWPWTRAFVEPLRGCKRVIVVADNDDAGRTAARTRAQLLREVCGDVRLIEYLPTEPKGDVSDLLAGGYTAQQLRELFESAQPVRAQVEKVSEVVLRQKLAPPPPPAIPTGFACLDQTIGGFRKGWTTVIGARPGVGKSSFAEQLAYSVSERQRVLFCSLEMGTDRSVDRLVARSIGRHERSYLHSGRPVNAKDYERLDLHFTEYRNLDDISKAVVDTRPDLTIIDHSRKLDGWFKVERGSRADISAAVIMGQIVALGKSSGSHIVLLSQCSRSADNKRPDLSSLRDSGAVEEDADSVLFLHRPFQYALNEEDDVCEVIGWKARGYGAFLGHLRWTGSIMFFDDPGKEQAEYFSRCCPHDKSAKVVSVA